MSKGASPAPGRTGLVARLAVAGVGVLVVGLPVLLVVLLLGVTVLSASAASAGGCTRPLPEGTGATPGVLLSGLSTNPRVRAQQWANAAAIVGQGRADAAPTQGLVVAVMTARQESSLINVGFGDQAGPDSRGLFQQRDPWGPLAVRMDPRGAAHLFFTGGAALGTPGLLDIPRWRSLPLWLAANRVQRSAFPRAYAKWQQLAQSMVTALLANPTPGRQAPPLTDPAGWVCTDAPPLGSAAGGAGWVRPLPSGSYTLSSPFGMRALGGRRRMHQGQDLAVPVGAPVYAAAAGTVVFAGNASGYGNLVTIRHPGGVTTLYGHLSAIRVRPGPIQAGTLIGLSGGARGAPGAGDSTGPHLHFQIEVRGRPVDPVAWMAARGTPL